MKIYHAVDMGTLDNFKNSQKSLKVTHCIYFTVIFAHYQRILMNFVYYLNFDINALTESKIKNDSVSLINTELNNNSTEHTPTEIAAGGALLYIKKKPI